MVPMNLIPFAMTHMHNSVVLYFKLEYQFLTSVATVKGLLVIS